MGTSAFWLIWTWNGSLGLGLLRLVSRLRRVQSPWMFAEPSSQPGSPRPVAEAGPQDPVGSPPPEAHGHSGGQGGFPCGETQPSGFLAAGPAAGGAGMERSASHHAVGSLGLPPASVWPHGAWAAPWGSGQEQCFHFVTGPTGPVSRLPLPPWGSAGGRQKKQVERGQQSAWLGGAPSRRQGARRPHLAVGHL